MITLRSATMNDAELVYRWRNSDYVRSTRLNQDVDDFNAHMEWWQDALDSASRDLYMIESDGQLVGHMRFDHEPDLDLAEVSIVLSPEHVGKGLGTEALKVGCAFEFEQNKYLETILATILKDNTASIRAFMKAGFKKAPDFETLDSAYQHEDTYYLSREQQ